MNNYYEFLDWPVIPEHLLKNLNINDESLPRMTYDFERGEVLDLDLNKEITHININQFKNEELKIWLKNNTKINEKMIFNIMTYTSHMDLHSDVRQYCYSYILNTGGEKVITTMLDKNKNQIDFIFPPFKWYKFNTHYLHKTTGITGYRVILQLTPKSAFNHLNDLSENNLNAELFE